MALELPDSTVKWREKARAIAALYPADPQFAAHIEQRCGKGSR